MALTAAAAGHGGVRRAGARSDAGDVRGLRKGARARRASGGRQIRVRTDESACIERCSAAGAAAKDTVVVAACVTPLRRWGCCRAVRGAVLGGEA